MAGRSRTKKGMSREKGKAGEREVVKLLQPVVTEVCLARGFTPIELERNLMQSHKGGYDIVGLDWLALEVKRVEKQHASLMHQWWVQTVTQAHPGKLPVLFYRRNLEVWRVRTYGSVWHGAIEFETVVDISVESFLGYFKLRLQCELR